MKTARYFKIVSYFFTVVLLSAMQLTARAETATPDHLWCGFETNVSDYVEVNGAKASHEAEGIGGSHGAVKLDLNDAVNGNSGLSWSDCINVPKNSTFSISVCMKSIDLTDVNFTNNKMKLVFYHNYLDNGTKKQFAEVVYIDEVEILTNGWVRIARDEYTIGTARNTSEEWTIPVTSGDYTGSSTVELRTSRTAGTLLVDDLKIEPVLGTEVKPDDLSAYAFQRDFEVQTEDFTTVNGAAVSFSGSGFNGGSALLIDSSAATSGNNGIKWISKANMPKDMLYNISVYAKPSSAISMLQLVLFHNYTVDSNNKQYFEVVDLKTYETLTDGWQRFYLSNYKIGDTSNSTNDYPVQTTSGNYAGTTDIELRTKQTTGFRVLIDNVVFEPYAENPCTAAITASSLDAGGVISGSASFSGSSEFNFSRVFCSKDGITWGLLCENSETGGAQDTYALTEQDAGHYIRMLFAESLTSGADYIYTPLIQANLRQIKFTGTWEDHSVVASVISKNFSMENVTAIIAYYNRDRELLSAESFNLNECMSNASGTYIIPGKSVTGAVYARAYLWNDFTHVVPYCVSDSIAAAE